jgi:hypothetical protein
MADLENRIREDRSLRNSARGVFDAGIGTVKADLAARGIGGRIADHATGQVRDVTDEALAVARESKGIIAGTIAALGLWLARKPLLAAAQKLFGDQASVQAETLEANETPGEPSSD